MERAPIIRDEAPFLVDPSALMRRGPLTIVGCASGHAIAGRIARRYREREQTAGGSASVGYQGPIDTRFGDGEIRVRLSDSVSGHDVYLVQSLSNPREQASINENYLAFLIAARALKEHGARQVTGILPYLAYARQDKPTLFRREPVTASLMAELSRMAGVDRLITWHPHCRQIQGFYGAAQVNLLEPFTFFSRVFAGLRGRDDVVVVAPDAGASKLVSWVSERLEVGSALAAKHRPQSEKVSSTQLIGDLRNKRCAIILDDILASGGTINAVVERIAAQSAVEEIRVGVSHNLCSPKALEVLEEMRRSHGLTEVVVTDSIPQTDSFIKLPYYRVHGLADGLCRTINRTHCGASVSEVFEGD